VELAPRADAWIVGEGERLQRLSKPAARRFRTLIREAGRFLSEYPLGAPVNEDPFAAPGSRVLTRGDYLISYVLDYGAAGEPGRVMVYAVRHGRQEDARRPPS
jgi:plasmid stabilization system protein ParE